jgi:hypothetical protein
VTAGAIAYLGQGLPYKLGLLVAVLAGIVVGLVLKRMRRAEERLS